jgi:hypothetical protein
MEEQSALQVEAIIKFPVSFFFIWWGGGDKLFQQKDGRLYGALYHQSFAISMWSILRNWLALDPAQHFAVAPLR